MRAYLRSLNPQLPRDVWILQAGGLVNMFGNGVIGPFLIIYLHNVRGISLGIAGLVVASGSLAAFASGFVGGALSDRLGPRVVLSGALVLAAVAFALFPLIRETWQAFALNLLVGVATGAFWPSQSTLLSSLTPPGRRHAAFAQQRMTMNVGFALGALVAGCNRAHRPPEHLHLSVPAERRDVPGLRRRVAVRTVDASSRGAA